jgi:hypothetical protein
MRINHVLSDYLNFSVNLFWCRWDKALFNWSIFYILSVLIVYIGRENDILFSDNSFTSLLLTAFVVTIVTATISLLRKNKAL